MKVYANLLMQYVNPFPQLFDPKAPLVRVSSARVLPRLAPTSVVAVRLGKAQ
jgi:hypothetical protein